MHDMTQAESMEMMQQDIKKLQSDVQAIDVKLGRIDEKLDRAALTNDVASRAEAGLAVSNSEIRNIKERLDRSEQNSRWAIGVAISVAIAMVGFIFTVTSMITSMPHK